MEWQLWEPWVLLIAGVAATIVVAVIIHFVAFRLLRRLVAAASETWGTALQHHGTGATRWAFVVLLLMTALRAAEPLLPRPDLWLAQVRHLLALLLIAAVAAVLVAGLRCFETVIAEQFRLDVKDNLRARKVHTQIKVLDRIAIVFVLLIALASMLMTFPQVRQLGGSLLASAGIVGIIVGVAAQRSLANLIAGIQLALTQPIRLDDVVIVENEWGRIEEITLTYVVVRIWDLRRLILPITYFIEKPFQNWTRVTADLLGTVFVHVDYEVPVAEVRAQLRRVLEQSDRWDRKAWALQVTDLTENTMQLRALMSAPDASTAWELRCEVREKLIDWIHAHYPRGLPQLRARVAGSDGDDRQEHAADQDPTGNDN